MLDKVAKLATRGLLLGFTLGAVFLFFFSVLMSGQSKIFVGETSPGPVTGTPAGETVDYSIPQPQQPGPGAAAPTVALTFDDGIHDVHTEQVLDKLAEYDVKATFFVVGNTIPGRERVLQRMIDEGHEVGLHTYNHSRLGDLPDRQVRQQFSFNQQMVVGAVRVRPTIMRSPYSFDSLSLPERELRAVQTTIDLGLTPVFSDNAPRDYTGLTAEEIAEQVVPADNENAILTLHDGGGDRQATVDSLDIFIPELQSRGYQFQVVSEYGGLPPAAEATTVERVLGSAVLWSAKPYSLFKLIVIPTISFLAVIMVVRYLLSVVLAIKQEWKERRKAPVLDSGFTPGVSLIIPAYNEEVGIRDALVSLTQLDYAGDVELVVVDDGSTDRTAEIARQVPGVRVIQKINGGKASALNAGIRQARHEICVLVDGDTVFPSDSLTHLVQPFVDPKVGAVSGNPKVGNRVNFLTRIQHLEYLVGCSLDRRMQDELNMISCIPGAVGAFRREALIDVGGVPEVTLAEDTDLTVTMGAVGWRIAYATRALAYTEVPSTIGVLWKQRVRWAYGVLQVIWKQRKSPRKGSQNVYRVSVVVYLAIMNVGMALLAPLVDVFAAIALIQGRGIEILYLWLMLIAIQLFSNFLALVLDREPITGIWYAPLQVLFYRYFNFFVTLVALRSVLSGQREAWNKPKRIGLSTSKARAGTV